jgi:hypothetical protein
MPDKIQRRRKPWTRTRIDRMRVGVRAHHARVRLALLVLQRVETVGMVLREDLEALSCDR